MIRLPALGFKNGIAPFHDHGYYRSIQLDVCPGLYILLASGFQFALALDGIHTKHNKKVV